MSRFPLRNVLLSAVLASSTIFSALTLPVVLLKPEPIVIELPPLFEGEIQPMFDSENRNLAIPYIGFSIVMSVGAGMTAVEMSRKWQAARQQKQALVNAVPEGLPRQAIEAEAEYFPGYDVSLAASDQTFAEIASEADSDSIWSAVLPDFFAFNNVSNDIPNPAANDIPTEVLQPPGTSQICQVEAPKLKRRLSGILSNGHYYRLFKARRTRTKSLEIPVVDRRGDRAMIAEIQSGRAV